MMRRKENASGRKRRADLLRLCLAVLFALLTWLLMFLFERYPECFFPWYRRFSRGAMRVISCVTSAVPFALWDLIILGTAAGAAAGLIVTAVKKKPFLRWLGRVLLTVSLLFFLETALWNLNHYGPRLKDEMGLSVEQYTDGDLAETLAFCYDRAAELALLTEREEDGSLCRRRLTELLKEAGRIFEPLEEEYEVFSGGSKRRAKYLTAGSLLLPYLGITGEFAGFTAEATVPLGQDTVNQPFSLSHEVAHRLGIASEEDANFAAFLACTASEDPLFSYSGYYTAFVYCYNALYEASPGLLSEIMAERKGEGYDLVCLDCTLTSEYYARFESPLEEAGEKVNDASLKAFSEEEGTKSYSLVVNELIAWYRKTGTAE